MTPHLIFFFFNAGGGGPPSGPTPAGAPRKKGKGFVRLWTEEGQNALSRAAEAAAEARRLSDMATDLERVPEPLARGETAPDESVSGAVDAFLALQERADDARKAAHAAQRVADLAMADAMALTRLRDEDDEEAALALMMA